MNNPNQGNVFARKYSNNRNVNKRENAMIAQDDTFSDSIDKTEKAKVDKSCLYCLGNHWIIECSDFNPILTGLHI